MAAPHSKIYIPQRNKSGMEALTDIIWTWEWKKLSFQGDLKHGFWITVISCP